MTLTAVRNADALGLDLYQEFFVDSTGGDDDNAGTTPETAWETLDYAIGYVASLKWRAGLGSPSIKLANGAYTTSFSADTNGLPIAIGCDTYSIGSVSGNKTDVTINAGGYFFVSGPQTVSVQNVTFTGRVRFTAFQGGGISLYQVTIPQDQASRTIFTARQGGRLTAHTVVVNYSNPSQFSLALAELNGIVSLENEVTITGTPDYGAGTIKAMTGGLVKCDGILFSGAATNLRYWAESFGKIYTAEGGASFIPGSDPGYADGSSLYF